MDALRAGCLAYWTMKASWMVVCWVEMMAMMLASVIWKDLLKAGYWEKY